MTEPLIIDAAVSPRPWSYIVSPSAGHVDLFDATGRYIGSFYSGQEKGDAQSVVDGEANARLVCEGDAAEVRTLREKVAGLAAFVHSDADAISYQTLGQYRGALLKMLAACRSPGGGM